MTHQGPQDIGTKTQPMPLFRMASMLKWGTCLVLLIFPCLAFAQDAATQAMSVEYRDIPGVGSRNVIWVVAQQHLLLAGFVLGVPIFAWVCEIVGWKTKEPRYDKLAKEFTKIADLSLCHDGVVWRYSPVSIDWPLSQINGLSDGYIFPLIYCLLSSVSS